MVISASAIARRGGDQNKDTPGHSQCATKLGLEPSHLMPEPTAFLLLCHVAHSKHSIADGLLVCKHPKVEDSVLFGTASFETSIVLGV